MPDDQLRLIKRVNRSLKIDEERWPAKQCQWFINAQEDEGRRANNIDHHGDDYTKTMLEVYQAYEEACDRGGMIDFGEILLRAMSCG
jgi:DNA helicase-2/ATP-dependent DNA helicase PcrA